MIGAGKEGLDKALEYSESWKHIESDEKLFLSTCRTCKHCVLDESYGYQKRTFWQWLFGKSRLPSTRAVWYSVCTNTDSGFKASGTYYSYFKYHGGCHGDFWEKKNGDEKEYDEDSDYR